MSSRSDSSRVGWFSHDISKKDLKPGDHIYCYRAGFLYSHHGIYIGEKDCEVIHFAGEDDSLASKRGTAGKKSRARIRKCTLEEFTKGSTIRLVAYGVSKYSFKKRVSIKWEQSQSPAVVIRRAKEYLRNYWKWGEYDLMENNCETFAVHCKTGSALNLATQGKLPLGDKNEIPGLIAS